MSQSKWEYGGVYHQYNMQDVIDLPNNSKLKVCDLTKEMPDFMLQADTLFIDPPCSLGNLKTFHTKADRKLEYTFDAFTKALFERIEQINPKHLFIEVFKSNKDAFLEIVKAKYKSVSVYESFYYNKKQNKCFILHATNETENQYYEALQNIDEEKAIKWICENHKFDCIGDLCMGRGLVGKYAYLNKKSFAGTELNPKRLAVLVDFIKKQTNNGH
jgi:hypothetical protein